VKKKGKERKSKTSMMRSPDNAAHENEIQTFRNERQK